LTFLRDKKCIEVAFLQTSTKSTQGTETARKYNKMLSYRRETALQGALQFPPKVED